MELSDLPAPGENRWWLVELIRGKAARPLRVSLMENVSAVTTSTRPLASALMHQNANADLASVTAAAKAILAAVGDYASFTGDYGRAESVPPHNDQRESGWVSQEGAAGTGHIAHYFEKGALCSICRQATDKSRGFQPLDASSIKSPIDCESCTLALKREGKLTQKETTE